MTEEYVCPECGSHMKKSIEDYHYTECGLENVVLREVEICRCHECGYTWVDVGDLDELHRGIAQRLIEQEGKLNLREAQFLCDYAVSRMEGWKYNEVGEA